MTRYLKLFVLVMLTWSAFGCVSQHEADNLNTLYRKAQEQIVDLQAQLDEKDAQIAALREGAGMDADTLAQLEAAERDKAALEAALANMEAKLRAAAGITVLPADVDAALRNLADANPGLMSYDSKRGMVKFSSDLTFSLGSTSVNAVASAGLNKLAAILNSPMARPYEVRIVGHTDNVPIKRVRAQHPTNWHLSVHRAIAVKDVLGKAGVASTRLGVAGYGEFRPIVPNGPKGAQVNRRVEIYLVPMSNDDVSVEAEPAARSTPVPTASLTPERPDAFK